MTFSSPEVRHAYHALSTGMQVLLCAFWAQLAKQSKFVEVIDITAGEITLKISDKIKVNGPIMEALP